MFSFDTTRILAIYKEKVYLSKLNYNVATDILLEQKLLESNHLRFLHSIFLISKNYFLYLFSIASWAISLLIIVINYIVNIPYFFKIHILRKKDHDKHYESPNINKNYFFRYVFYLFAFPILIFLLLLIIPFVYLSSPVNQENVDFYLSVHQYRTAIAVRDSDENLIGAMQNPKKSPSEYINANDRSPSLYVDSVPDMFWRILQYREGRNISFKKNTLRSYKGIDLLAIHVNILSRIPVISNALGFETERGGSTPILCTRQFS